ncbi:hypothetical protein [Brevundimonas sp.]|uniref:hypothetical protein n=1 Tax=Brevundimonas sp. TaxID=1871086 RepID=UPI002D27B2A5|nr:hypothetical protein [Brevundimonas sp.]HYC74744.1 hypothetical protein [Brevundimonas sp.]
MAIEADILAEKHEDPTLITERRARTERRGRDRRKPGSRVNQRAPMRSTLQAVGLSAVGVVGTVMVITVLYSQIAGVSLPYVTLAFQAGAMAVATIVVAIGCVEQRLTEIRLELMMLNGGRRQGDDRRQGPRRGAAAGE